MTYISIIKFTKHASTIQIYLFCLRIFSPSRRFQSKASSIDMNSKKWIAFSRNRLSWLTILYMRGVFPVFPVCVLITWDTSLNLIGLLPDLGWLWPCSRAGSCPPPSKRAWAISPGSRASVGDGFHQSSTKVQYLCYNTLPLSYIPGSCGW